MPPTTPDPKQAAADKAAADEKAQQAKLDKEAADLQAKADAEAAEAARVAADAQKAAERAEDHGQARAARCPCADCRERLERYTGANPHKLGSHYCPKHGRLTL